MSLVHRTVTRFLEKQFARHSLIKSLHEKGFGYRKTTKFLNEDEYKFSLKLFVGGQIGLRLVS